MKNPNPEGVADNLPGHRAQRFFTIHKVDRVAGVETEALLNYTYDAITGNMDTMTFANDEMLTFSFT